MSVMTFTQIFKQSSAPLLGLALLASVLLALPAVAIGAPSCGPFTVYLESLKAKSGGNAVGDIGVGHVRVFDSDQTELGFQSVSTLVAPGVKAGETRLIVNAYLTLGDSQLVYAGTYPAPGEADSVPNYETELAVLGGTGRFKGALGQATFVTESGRRAAKFDITCSD